MIAYTAARAYQTAQMDQDEDDARPDRSRPFQGSTYGQPRPSQGPRPHIVRFMPGPEGEPLPVCPCCLQGWRHAPKIKVTLESNSLLLEGVTRRVTPLQAEILTVLIAAAPRAISTDRLVSRVWGMGEREDAEGNLKVQIVHIRRLLADSSFRIMNTHGFGYQLVSIADMTL